MDIALVIGGTRCVVDAPFMDIYTGGGGLRRQGAKYKASAVAGVQERGGSNIHAAAIRGGAVCVPLVFELETERVSFG